MANIGIALKSFFSSTLISRDAEPTVLTHQDVLIGPMSMANLLLMLDLATYIPHLLEFKTMKLPILDPCIAEKVSIY